MTAFEITIKVCGLSYSYQVSAYNKREADEMAESIAEDDFYGKVEWIDVQEM